MYPSPRPELAGLRAAVHGGDAPPGTIDFSTGVSPLPPPARILDAIRAADVTQYPSPDAASMRGRAAAVAGLSPAQVVVGNGSTELIWAIARAFVGNDRTALILTPAFAEYAQGVRASGGRISVVEATGVPSSWSVDAVAAAIRRERPAVVFAGRPNNPTLSQLPLDAWQWLAAGAPETLFVGDEAYLPLFDDVPAVPPGRNLACLRSLTKVFALPGLRIGYLLAGEPVASAVQAALPPWNVSAPAQAGGAAALEEAEAMVHVRKEIARRRAHLATLLRDAGARIDAEGGPFLLCRVAHAQLAAGTLAAQGLRVRDCTSFGLPSHLRLGVRDERAHARLAEAWRVVGVTG